MVSRTFQHLRRNLVAYVALFFALAGTSFGAVALVVPANSVGTKQLKNGAVTKKKINPKTIAALKGANGAKGTTGARGPTGGRGLTGGRGPTGARGLTGGRGATGAKGSTGAAGPAAQPLVWSYIPLAPGDDASNVFTSMGPFTIRARCTLQLQNDVNYILFAELYVTSTLDGQAQVEKLSSANGASPTVSMSGVSLGAGVEAQLDQAQTPLNSILKHSDDVIVSAGGHVLGLHIVTVANATSVDPTPPCSFNGVATYAP